jgi:hypothetical protein
MITSFIGACGGGGDGSIGTDSSNGDDTIYTPPAIVDPVFACQGLLGFGSVTKGGYGGQIIKVTNLNDSGSGSLRAAVSTPGPRIIVFDVGGEIRLRSQLAITSPYLTIAGQTAPAPGIMLSGTGLKVETHELILQHIFVRHTTVDGTDAIDIRSGNIPLYNIVIDHVSASWGDDENLSFNPGPRNTIVNNVTFSNNLIAEGNGQQFGSLIAEGSKQISLIRNLWMSNKARQPRINGNVKANLVNNLSYNVGAEYSTVIGSAGGPTYLSFLGNVYIAGPNTDTLNFGIGTSSEVSAGTLIYLADNIASGTLNSLSTTPYLTTSPPVKLDRVSPLPSAFVEAFVLKNAGARPGERDGVINNDYGDPVDERLVFEVQSRSGSLKSSPPDVPMIKTTSRPFLVSSNPYGDDDDDGCPNIVEILNKMSA